MPFGVPPLVNGVNAEVLPLLPEHRGDINAGNESNLLVVVLVFMPVMVMVVTLPLHVVMVLVIFGFRKIARDSNDWGILLPLNPHGLLREVPRQLTTANSNCC